MTRSFPFQFVTVGTTMSKGPAQELLKSPPLWNGFLGDLIAKAAKEMGSKAPMAAVSVVCKEKGGQVGLSMTFVRALSDSEIRATIEGGLGLSPQAEVMSEEMENGWVAFAMNVPKEENPHPPGHASDEWLRGWEFGQDVVAKGVELHEAGG